jgi:hypothetical protein
MMLFGLQDAVSNALDSIPVVDSVVSYVEGKAKAGAESAIPDIQNQVKAAIQPYIVGIGLISIVALLFSMKAYTKVNRT